MSRPRFLADEDLRYEIVSAVRRLEPAVDIRTVVEVGRSTASDAEILEFAKREERILISHDVNTLRAVAERRMVEGLGLSGVFLVPQHQITRAVAESIVLVWAASEAAEWIDRVVYIPL